MNSKLRSGCLFVNYCFGRWSPNVNDGAFKRGLKRIVSRLNVLSRLNGALVDV